MKRWQWIGTLFSLLLMLPLWTGHGAEEGNKKKKIALVAGVKSHGPEGNRIHDYPWSVRLLKVLLERSAIADRVEVVTFFDGWPANPDALKNCDALMIISDGRDGDAGREAPHLAHSERIQQVEDLADQGCGILTFHFSTFAPDALSKHVLDWYGGYFDWETDGKREWYSDIKTMEAEVEPASPEHPVLNGVKPFTMREEFYFDIRFRPGQEGWTPVWRIEALPDTNPNGDVVAWALQRKDGGRGFATTCGHFYDNWKHAEFRKTLLNAIAWSAHIEVPEMGIDAEFVTRKEIAEHLKEPELRPSEQEGFETETRGETGEEDPYANAPYWYKPGHPVDPAESVSVRTLPGFEVERILQVPEEFGSWTALTVDAKGRLIAAAQHKAGLYRITPPNGRDPNARTRVERMKGVAGQVGWSHGLLYAHDSLYVTVTEGNDTTATGIYRLQDLNNDDELEDIERVVSMEPAGEHGAHNLVPGPEGRSVYLIAGNGTALPQKVGKKRTVSTDGVDHLMPPGFESSHHTTAGWVCRFEPDGSDWELHASGLRNSYDIAFNKHGDLFTFDSDMEWDLGTPWYRPTRICHVVSGGEFGWRAGAAKWPEHFADSVAPVINVGPASPTGLVFGYGAKFPEKFQRALFVCDWTFATIHAIHLQPDGAGYSADMEEFVGGRGLPVTDAVIGGDGHMYFIVGGRKLGSAVYRVMYTGEESTAPVERIPFSKEIQKLHGLRRGLESWHGKERNRAVVEAWPHLGHKDRSIRFAARVAVEHQPVNSWRDKVYRETDRERKLNALLALVRQESPQRLGTVIEELDHVSWMELDPMEKLLFLRIAELALARGEDFVMEHHKKLQHLLRPHFPSGDQRVDRELARLLCFLGDATAIDPALKLMKEDRGEAAVQGLNYFMRNPKYGEAVRDMLESAPLVERMHYAQMLLWLEDEWRDRQREEFFRLIVDAMSYSKGGHTYREFWSRIRELALEQVPKDQRNSFERMGARSLAVHQRLDLPQPEGPGQIWTVEEILERLPEGGLRNRNRSNGKQMFAAAGCKLCHRYGTEGGATGPDLTSIGNRFTVRDLVVAIVEPSKAVSDQYQMNVVELQDGSTMSGRIVARDNDRIRIAINPMQPAESTELTLDKVKRIRAVPVSTMPSGLLNGLNENEVLDLLAYLVSGER